MTTEELQNINQVAPSEKVVKIRYSKRMHRRLAAVLPTYFRIELDRLFPEGKIAAGA
jgi:hypothetical protein